LKNPIDINAKFREIYKNPLFKLKVITTVITVYLIIRQENIGVPYYDVFVYLNNALIFAGIPVGNMSVIYLSPLMPILTSLVFRTGYISANVIFILDGLIFISGVIGLYLIFRERFNEIQSLVGSLIFISFPLVYSWAASGAIDVPGVSFSIWVIYALVMGVRKNSKLLYLVFPLFTVAFLARYTSAILVFPMILYLLMNDDFIKNMKKISFGILAGLVIITPFFIYIYEKLGNLNSIINIFTSTLIGSGASVNDLGYNPDKLYYLTHILNYISVSPLQGTYSQILNPSYGFPSVLSYITVIIVLFGLSIYLYGIMKKKIQEIDIYNKNKTNLQLIILILLFIVGILSFFTSSYLITEFIILGALYVGYRLLKGTKIKNLEIDFLFLSWFVSFFIFHSIIPLKVDRYFITMSPALAYFIILGLSIVIEKYKFKFKQEKLKSGGLYFIVGLVFLSSITAVNLGHTPKHGYGFYIQSASDWLMEYDPNYQDKVIYSDYDPALTWSLKKEVKFGVPRLYTSSEAFSNYLIGNNADYYIDTLSNPKPDIPGYHIIKNITSISIYESNS
jgi:4-amino-4-deoxy-L-arabinose transferase-like glycosyltransferase